MDDMGLKPVGLLMRKILFIMVAGGLCAIAVSAVVLFYFKPVTGPKVETILSSPSSLDSLSFTVTDADTGETVKYVFDHVELYHLNQAAGDWATQIIDRESYRKVYALLLNKVGLMEVFDHILLFFEWEKPATLTLVARKEGSESGKGTYPFQKVQFLVTDDYFRIQYLEPGQEVKWAYFYSPAIYTEILQVLDLQ